MLIQSFINGQFPQRTQQKFVKKNPYTAMPQHEVISADLADAVTAIQSSQKFFQDYRQSSVQQRQDYLKAIKKNITENKSHYAKLEAQDQGLPLDFVLKYSLTSLLTSLDGVLAELSTTSNVNAYSPVGPISIICSWNLSLRIICERVFSALAAGNTVVIKVSSQSPITAFILSEIIQKAELPKGLIQVIVSNDLEIKKLLITHPGIKAISFVGQLTSACEILKTVSVNSAQIFKKIQISTGTKNSAVSLDEPGEPSATEILNSFLIGQGQLAWNSARLFVLEKNEKLWSQWIAEKLGDLKPSEGIEDPSPWTPCLKHESYKTFAEINALALADQARLIQTTYNLTESQKKCFLPVTFTQDMSNCSTLQQDQVLSPLFIFSSVKYPFDIQKYSNVSYFGFAAHLWGDPARLAKVADSLEVGQICENKWSVQSPTTFKAVKQSGYGLQDNRVFGDFFSNVKILT